MREFGDFQLDVGNQCLWHRGQRLTLTPRPFGVLRYLVENSQRLVTYDELLETLWPETYVQPQVLRTYVLELRKLLGDDPAYPRFIETVPRRGYRFLIPVTRESVSNGERLKFIGRDVELATLHAQLARACNADRSTLFVTGEAGIGKTALIDAFCNGICEEVAQRVRTRVHMARGQSIEGFGGKEAFYPVREALNGLCSAKDDKTSALLAAAAPSWFGKNRLGLPSLGEICEALEAVSQNEALLLIFEDVHLADDSTLDLIAALARRRSHAKLMLLASFRPADVDLHHPLRRLEHDLAVGRRSEELCLGPLGRDAVYEYVRREMDTERLPAGLVSLIHQNSAGNPLYMTAMLDHLRTQGVLRIESGEVVLSQPLNEIRLGVPDGLAQIIELQLDRLNREDRCLLEAGSIAGTIFPAWVAAAVLERKEEEIEEAFASLVRRVRLLSVAGYDELPGGSYSAFYVFSHALYRQVLYSRMPAARRSQWHLRVADRLRAMFAGNEARVAHEIAAHVEAGNSTPGLP